MVPTFLNSSPMTASWAARGTPLSWAPAAEQHEMTSFKLLIPTACASSSTPFIAIGLGVNGAVHGERAVQLVNLAVQLSGLAVRILGTVAKRRA